MKKQTKTYYGPYELTDHLQHQFVVTRSEEHGARAHARPPSTPLTENRPRTVNLPTWLSSSLYSYTGVDEAVREKTR